MGVKKANRNTSITKNNKFLAAPYYVFIHNCYYFNIEPRLIGNKKYLFLSYRLGLPAELHVTSTGYMDTHNKFSAEFYIKLLGNTFRRDTKN